MSANAFQPGAIRAVVPVVDYEPPAYGGPPDLPPVATLRRHIRPPAPDAARGSGPDPRPAAVFADAALRRVLEVIDRRRPLVQLKGLLAPGLVDSLLTGTGGCAGGVARLRRVHAQLTRPDGRIAEVAANYSRGERVHAIACRMEQVCTATGPRWQVVALHLG